MSSIPYNYDKYIDDVTKMKQRGAISSGEQQASPSSAGSRGLAKTMQFTNNPTQMKMGNSPIAESMVEIRNILNRIDGINAPVQEGHYPHIKSFDKLYGINDMQQYKAMADDAQTMDMGEFMDTYSSVIDMAGDFWEDHQKTSESNEGAINEDPNTLAKELASEIMKYVRKGFDHIPADALKAKAKEYLSSIKESAVKEAPENTDIDIRQLLLDISSMKDRIAELAISDDAKTSAFTALAQVEDDLSTDESYEPFPEADEMTFEDDDAFYEAFGELGFPEDENELFDAEYRGRKVPLNKPMRGDVKKFKVYVKDPKSGNVKKVNFGHGGSSARKAGQKTMKIRKSNPKARKSFRARHNCANPGPKTKARYWSCRKW